MNTTKKERIGIESVKEMIITGLQGYFIIERNPELGEYDYLCAYDEFLGKIKGFPFQLNHYEIAEIVALDPAGFKNTIASGNFRDLVDFLVDMIREYQASEMPRIHSCYHCGKVLSDEDVIAGQKALDKRMNSDPEWEGFVHCESEQSPIEFLYKLDFSLMDAFAAADYPYFAGGVIVCECCAETE